MISISIADLGSADGSAKEIDLHTQAPANFGVPLIGVEQGSDIHINARMQLTSDGILVQGDAAATAVGQCARCLRDISRDMDEEFAELVFFPQAKARLLEEGDEEAEDLLEVVDQEVDLEPIVRDALILAMPLSPLCKPNCRGLCPICGQRWDDLPADHHHDVVDTRFSVLDELAEQLRQAEEAAQAAEGTGGGRTASAGAAANGSVASSPAADNPATDGTETGGRANG